MTNLMKRFFAIALLSTVILSNAFAAQGRTDGITITSIKMYDPQTGDKTRTAGEVVGTIRASKAAVWAKLIDFNNLKEWFPRTTYSEFKGYDAQGRSMVYLKCSASAYGERDMLNAYTLNEESMALAWEEVKGTWEYMRGRTVLEDTAPGVVTIKVNVVGKTGLGLIDNFAYTRRKLLEETLTNFVIGLRGQVGDL